MTPLPEQLAPSPLGTKDYWDNLYQQEIHNRETVPDDEGTIWFSDADAEENVLALLDRLVGAADGDDSDDNDANNDTKTTHLDGTSKETASLLDLGTGNGHMVFALRDAGWTGPLVGVDYSPASVALANSILADRPGLASTAPIRFDQLDVLAGPVTGGRPALPDWLPAAGFDIVHDKGTFDAVCLNAETTTEGERVCQLYPAQVSRLVRVGGLFVITSCNWTEPELRQWFESGTELKLAARVKSAIFSFGGRTGQKVTTVAFKRIA